MASTPKFNQLNVLLADRIGDPVAAAATDGEVLDSSERSAYINQAMRSVFARTWLNVGGDVKAFMRVMPEMVGIETLSTSPQSSVNLSLVASPHEDIYEVVSGLYDGTFVTAWSAERKHMIDSGRSGYNPTDEDPVMVKVGRIIYFYPEDTFSEVDVDVTYIILPVLSSGDDYSVSGAADIPFSTAWENVIVDEAYKLVLIDRQETV